MINILTDDLGRILTLPKEEQEFQIMQGKEVTKANSLVIKEISALLSTSLGPNGLDKILQSKDGDITVTNDGATILQNMEMTENPISRLIVQLSQSQDEEIGDGTTSVVILANALLTQALLLIEKNIHPIRIIEGYEKACEMVVEYLEKISDSILDNPYFYMSKAASTTLNSKIVSKYNDYFSKIAVNTILKVCDMKRRDVDFDLIKISTKIGKDLGDTILVDGVVINKEFSHLQMRKEIKNAKIALLSCPFEPPKIKTKHTLEISSPESYKKLQEYEKETFLEMISSLKRCGADLVICQWGFDDEANSLLMENDLPAIRWVGGSEMELIAVHTRGSIISRFEDLRPEDLGRGSVKELSLGTENEKIIVIENNAKKNHSCDLTKEFDGEDENLSNKIDTALKNKDLVQETATDSVKQNTVTILIRGCNKMVLEEAERSLHDALCTVRNLLVNDKIVYGGGSCELACSLFLKKKSMESSDILFDILEGFSVSLEEIPMCLARNSDLDAVEYISDLKKKQRETGCVSLGVDCMVNNEIDMKKNFVFDSLKSKSHLFRMATQMVNMILKIDEVFLTEKK
ncbi:subunit epsilon of T-complex protein 1 [Hamiltosporidium tvaerminnensis]|uniref:Subunit epsilon of T-complex protein 1 n=2 Tax=Hamiltosporidium TaxID=1176354 RepID=A0A4Q9LNH6_9MICR|nr:T-complex protein 1 subunit epsilon [Hamiltosporidium tvaerminnensis]TBU04998.1 subunit epsilon of T-complex protein 1 [Hamiltosporidium magnivora]TBU05208.1 subunit epsilon of T-complex protein 1 [Hamiltosporidium tvaerminnensis]TBU09031.1 subunit epsilon of T-complex protein 1 [Hamiltosporidium magnivora]